MLDRASVNAFTADLLDAGGEPATARARQLALRRFSAWLLEAGESDADHLLGRKSPKLDTKVVEPLTAEQIKALVDACAGRDLRDRRDEALVRLMIETGARAGEVVALGTADVDLSTGTATVRRDTGGRGRVVPFGPQTSRALDRYLRARRGHRLADTPALWLGDRGKAFSYDALHKTLGERARAAGLEGFRPHRLRHTAAHRWLAAGGSEGGLMAVAGWTRPDMLLRQSRVLARLPARLSSTTNSARKAPGGVHPSTAGHCWCTSGPRGHPWPVDLLVRVSRSTITRVIREVRLLLAERRCTVPDGVRLRTWADVATHLGASGRLGLGEATAADQLSHANSP